MYKNQGCELSEADVERLCKYVKDNRHLKILKWARTIQYPWENLTCAAAAENVHLEVLHGGRAKGCL